MGQSDAITGVLTGLAMRTRGAGGLDAAAALPTEAYTVGDVAAQTGQVHNSWALKASRTD